MITTKCYYYSVIIDAATYKTVYKNQMENHPQTVYNICDVACAFVFSHGTFFFFLHFYSVSQ